MRKLKNETLSKNYFLKQELKELKRTPLNKLNKRLFKTQRRLYWAKQHSKDLETKLNQITDVLKDKDRSI